MIKEKGRSCPSLTATTTSFGTAEHLRCSHAHLRAPIYPALLQSRTRQPNHGRTALRAGDVILPTSRL
jgi:hypothetical protein